MFSKPINSLFVGLALASIAFAHFTLDFPLTRGFDEDKEPTFCGGFPTNASGRQVFPLSGAAPVLINSHHQTAQVAIILSVNPNPTAFADFNSSNKVDFLMPFGTIKGQGQYCFTVDIATLASQISPAPVNGTLATLQVEFNGGDGVLLQCSDLILVQGAAIPGNVTCTNSTGTSTTSSASNSNSSSSGSSTAAKGAKSDASNHLISLTLLLGTLSLAMACLGL